MATRDVIKQLHTKIKSSRQLLRDLQNEVNAENLTEQGKSELGYISDGLSDAEAACLRVFKAEGMKMPKD
jgi:hypothetical protein